MKPINDRVQHEFQEFGRRRLGAWIVQDLDAYGRAEGNLYFPDEDTHTLLVSDPSSFLPRCLIECKRSTAPAASWRPYVEDRRNYQALVEVARLCEIPLLVVYHVKGRRIDDDSYLAVFLLEQAIPAFRYERRVMTADEFAVGFRNPTSLFRSARVA